MDESGIVKCPECGGEIEKGYLVSEAIKCSTQGHPQWALEQETIVHGYARTFTNTKAFRCPACRLALFCYERKKEVPLSFLKKCVECGREIPLASEECSYCGARQKGGMKTWVKASDATNAKERWFGVQQRIAAEILHAHALNQNQMRFMSEFNPTIAEFAVI